MILSRKIISIVGKKRRSEILKRIRFVLCKVKKKKRKEKKDFRFMKNQIYCQKQIKKAFERGSTFMRQIYYSFLGTRGPRKDTTSYDYHYKSILSLRRGFARGQEERAQNTSWKAEWRGWCSVRVKVGEGRFQ